MESQKCILDLFVQSIRRLILANNYRRIKQRWTSGKSATGQQNSVACTHAACQATGRLIKVKILSQRSPFPTKLCAKIVAAIPLLLCTKGDWPPTLPKPALDALLAAFVAVCLAQKSTGFLGQQLPEYGTLVSMTREST